MATETATNGNGSPDAYVTLICQEWPQLAKEKVGELRSDHDKLVAYVAQETGHTRALTERHLAEIKSVSGLQGILGGSPQVAALLSKIEMRAQELLKSAQGDLEKTARASFEKSPWMTLGIAALFGLVLGLLWSKGGGRER